MANLLLSRHLGASVRGGGSGRLVVALSSSSAPSAPTSSAQRRYKHQPSAEYLHESIVPTMHYQKSLPR